MARLNIQLLTGLFVLLGVATFTYQAVTIGGVSFTQAATYTLKARFENISGLREGAIIEAAGVRVGTVSDITLDPQNYQAIVSLQIDESVPVQEDAIVSIRTQGIIGEKYIKISPGGFDTLLTDGMEVTETESAISIEELVSKYIFSGNQ